MIGFGISAVPNSTSIVQGNLRQISAGVIRTTNTNSAFRRYESCQGNSATPYSKSIGRGNLRQISAGVISTTITKSAFRSYVKAPQLTEDQLESSAISALFLMSTGKHLKATDSQAKRSDKFGLELIKCTLLRAKGSGLIRDGIPQAGKEIIKMANKREAQVLKKYREA